MEKEINEFCLKCQLPYIVESLELHRNALDVANANIKASQSPTEAEKYLQEADNNLCFLREDRVRFKVFIKKLKKRQICKLLTSMETPILKAI